MTKKITQNQPIITLYNGLLSVNFVC